jgi:DNA-binding MurR/RpiR family transcriptional regulator
MDSLSFLIKARIDTLPDSEKKIAAYILKKGRQVVYMNVTELAARSSSSQSAVIRLCKNLGIPGFNEFKIMLARDVFGSRDDENDAEVESRLQTNSSDIIDNVISSLAQGIEDLRSVVDAPTLDSAAELIEKSAYIQLFGVGTSSFVALDFYHKLNRLGYRCSFIQDIHLQLSAACALGEGTVGIFVSYSGETPEMVRAARSVLASRGRILSLTGRGNNSLSDIADVRLCVPVSESVMRQGASSSRIAQLAIIDMLFSVLVMRNPERGIEMLEKTLLITQNHNK